ncbi:MAG: DUF222 domain-containing protein, partial [Ilumatobacteraceae bacterium]
GRRCSRDAAAAARRAAVCEQLPDVHDALAAGDLSAGHADAIARTARNFDDAGRSQLAELQPAIVAAAATSSVEDFAKDMGQLERLLSQDDGLSVQARNRRDRRVRRWVDRNSGMCHTHLQLDAETDAQIAAALDAAVAAARSKPQDSDLTFDQLQADALVALITRPDGSTVDPGRPVPEVTVLIDLDTLRHGLHPNGVSETGDGNPLPADTARRRCCEAVIVPIVLNGAGVAVDQGRARRVATREQRRALRAMYATCGFPGCTVRFEECQIHHVVAWEHHGATDLANLLPVCRRHHHLVHEGGWRLTLHPDRTIELRRPDGGTHHVGTTVNRAPNGVAAHPPPPGRDDPSDQYPAIPAEPEPPPRALWQPNPACAEIPAHLISAALRAQAASDHPTGPRTQQAQIAHRLTQRLTTLHDDSPSPVPESTKPSARAPAA